MRCLLLAGLLVLAACGEVTNSSAPPLPAVDAAERVMVAGVSSGAAMAVQYQVAFSDDVAGAGLVAGGPWGCARGELARALGPCLNGDGIDVAGLVDIVHELAAAGRLAPLAELDDDRVYLFHGSRDTVVSPAVTGAVVDWYRRVAPGAALEVVDDLPVVHGWPTRNAGIACDRMAPPYINACGVDVAGEMLGYLYGDLEPPGAPQGPVREFDQHDFGDANLAATGYVYIPPACYDDAGCRVLLFLHGCNQSATQIGTELVESSGLLGWAASNDLIVLFPQVAPSSQAPLNPLGCWDWWGYGGADYLGREAPQIAAIRAMLARLQASR